MTIGPDGNLWYSGPRVDNGIARYLGRMTPAGAITEFHPYGGQGLTAGPDGNLWFTSTDGIGQVVMSTVPAPGQLFFTVTPCRVLDTRAALGASGGPTLVAGAVRSFPIAGICGIPPSARAIVANVTATNAGTDGSLQAYAEADRPPPFGVMSFKAGVTRANSGIIRVGPDGSVTVGCSSSESTDVVLDVTGFLE